MSSSNTVSGNLPKKGGRRNALKDLTKERLSELYEEHTDAEIASMLGVTDVAISYYRKKYKIRTLTARQRADRLRDGPTLEDLTPAKLIELYAQMGDRGVAQIYGVSKPTISKLRRKWGVASVSKSERSTCVEELTQEQKEACIGTLLGDGHMLDRGVLRVWHYYGQLGYLRHLHRILSPHVKSIAYSEKTLKGTLTHAFGFQTVQHVWLKSLRQLFYPRGRRIFPDSILRELSPRSLAFWYFDDGHLDSKLPSFALGDVSEEEALKVVRLVGVRFSLDTYLSPASTATCKILGVRARSVDAFFFMIRDFVVPDMLYKLPVKHWPKGLAPKLSLKTVSDKPLPKDLYNRCSHWKDLSDPEKQSLLEGVVAFWQGNGFPHPASKPEELEILSNLEERQLVQDGVIKTRFVGQSSCHAHARHIWEASSYGSPHSPGAIFKDPELLSQALRVGLDAGNIPTASRVRSSLRFWRRSGVYNFRPSAAKVLVDRFCRVGGTVYDPCAGYGGRLMGSLLSAARPKYVACEPNTKSYESLLRLHSWMTSYVSELEGKLDLKCSPAEDFDIQEASVDLVLTSPPYWKREVYSDESTQSSVRYPTYERWLEEFWGVVLKRSLKALKPGGWLILNVDDFKLKGIEYKLIDDTIQLVGMGAPEYLKYQLPGGGNITDNHEAVLCWCKGSPSVLSRESSEPLELSCCRDCKRPVVVEHLKGGVCLECLVPKGYPRTCDGCGIEFRAERKDQRYHDVNCAARHRRVKARIANPASEVRAFTCSVCGEVWETKEKGRFKWCSSCREARDLAKRTKQCGYRNCPAPEFVDGSPKNSMSYCCPEHRRREKLFRRGLAKDESYFKSPC